MLSWTGFITINNLSEGNIDLQLELCFHNEEKMFLKNFFMKINFFEFGPTLYIALQKYL